MKDCIFCKIVNKEIPNYTVYEDDHILAFLDIKPCVKGHTVVIPKVHAETIFEFNDELAKFMFPAVKKVMEHIDTVLQPEGYTVGWNHKEAGGQAVPHLHIHIIPRWKNDSGGTMHSVVQNPSDKSVEEVAALFR